jgi:hypothetical protein
MQSTTGKTVKEIIARENKRMEKICKEGMPKCYNGCFVHFFSAYCQNFSSNSIIQKEFKALLENAPWRKLARQIKKIHGHDFISAIETELKIMQL